MKEKPQITKRKEQRIEDNGGPSDPCSITTALSRAERGRKLRETIPNWNRLTPEERLQHLQFPRWALTTTADSERPPQKGYLIPIQGWDLATRPDRIFPSISLGVKQTIQEKRKPQRFTPALVVTVDMNKTGTFVDSKVSFSCEAIPETEVLKCDLVIGSKKPWVQKLWDRNWGKLPHIPRIYEYGLRSNETTGYPVLGPVLCNEYSRSPRVRRAKLSTAQERYLVMMLLHNYWMHQHDENDVSRSSDLKLLHVATQSHDHRNFATDQARAGIYSIQSKLVDHSTWFWYPNRPPGGDPDLRYHVITSEELPRHWFK